MIKIEPILEKAFGYLPNMGMTEEIPLGFKPYYDWGNEYNLRKTYLLKKTDIYPLIYQTSNGEIQKPKENSVTTNLRLILATQNLKTETLNKDRWAGSTYDDILFPLVSNIETLFTKGTVFLWNEEYRITKLPNYGKDTPTGEPKNVDIWDAILMEVDNLTIYGDRCLQKTINF